MIESIRMRKGVAAPDWSFAPGDIAVVGDKIDHEEAVRWLKAGIAEVEKGNLPSDSPDSTVAKPIETKTSKLSSDQPAQGAEKQQAADKKKKKTGEG